MLDGGERYKEERVVIGADFNGHVGEGNRGNENIMGRLATRREMRKDRWWWISRQEWKWLC